MAAGVTKRPMQNGTESGAIVAVGEARTALPSALETQTKAIGVIVPPPDIRVSHALNSHSGATVADWPQLTRNSCQRMHCPGIAVQVDCTSDRAAACN